mgnify:FL=1
MPNHVWVDCTKLSEEQIGRVLSCGYERFLFAPVQYQKVKEFVTEDNAVFRCDTPEELQQILAANVGCIVMSNSAEILKEVKAAGLRTAYFNQVTDYERLRHTAEIGDNYDHVVVQFFDETNIPLELLIATFQKNQSLQLLKYVSNYEEMKVVLHVMEHGSDGVVVQTEDVEELIKCSKLLEKTCDKIDLLEGEVVSIEHLGAGHRACIDTTSILHENEGMLIGSTAKGGILVSSETHFLPYMELRPFRVNAGAIHSYVWNNDKTSYLSELKAGSPLWTVATEGNARKVYVGRVKIETRPLLKINVQVEGEMINTIVQDDWHIRVLGPGGTVLNASSLKKGDKVMAYKMSGGRHVGIQIDEYLEEK